jgi:hypothetical protein
MRIADIYQTVADNINSAQDRGGDIVSYVDQMMTDINDSEIPTNDTNKKTLESQINATSHLLILKNNTYTVEVLNFVRELQKYVTEEYGSINTFLRDHGILVGVTFADISKTVGYPIDADNIVVDYGCDFYVSNSGNDSNDGRTAATAWATLDKVSSVLTDATLSVDNAISAGDIVGFRTDDIFVGTLDTSEVDGSSGNPITFTSYGTGNKPVITGKITLGDNWVHHSGNIWRYDVSSLSATHVRYLLLDGVDQTMSQSEVGYADNATYSSFQDYNLSFNPSFNPSVDPDYNPSDYDSIYVGAEVLMRTTIFTWDIRTVTDYDPYSGTICFAPTVSYILGTTGSSKGGYFFQNSLYILEQNEIQGEWVNEGDYIYYYSITDPYDLGTIEVSSVDTLMEIENSEYITVNNLKFMYANDYAILGDGANYKNINNCHFEQCNTGIFEAITGSSNSIIDNNIFTDMGSIAIHQRDSVDVTITNNTITNIGLTIGRMAYVEDSNTWNPNMWYSGIHCIDASGGLIKYNNITNVGYIGFNFTRPTDQVLIQYNYMKNPCFLLVDGGSFYSYSNAQPTVTSNINQITYRNNIAEYDDYDNVDRLIGLEGSTYEESSAGVVGLFKDGYLRAANYYDNFAFGFFFAIRSNASMYSVWSGNIGVDKYYISGTARSFYMADAASVFWVNNICENNVFVSNYVGSSRVGLVYDDQLIAASGNSFDYNKMLNPFTILPERISTLPSFNYLTIEEWKAYDAVGPHETSNVFLYSISGLSSESEFIWYATNPTKSTVSVSFPAGYRYYTVDGDAVTSDTLSLYEGKVYYRTIDEGMPQASSVTISENISANPSSGGVYDASYDYNHAEGNTESGSTYQWYRSIDGTVEARVTISGANSLSYDTTSMDIDQYVLFGVTPKSAAGAGSLVTGVERFSNTMSVVW